MRSFYAGSHWFWVLSRIGFVLMFGISMVQILGDGPLRDPDVVLVNAFSMLGTVVLAVLAGFALARARKPIPLRMAGGVFLVLFGIGLAVVLGLGLVPMGGLRFLLALLITWFLLAGLRDLIVP